MKFKNFLKSNSFSKLGLALFLFLAGSSFFYPETFRKAEAQAQDSCRVNVYFHVSDMQGKIITSVPNKDVNVILYAKYSDFQNMSNCQSGFLKLGMPKHRFRLVFTDGGYSYVGPETNVNFVLVDEPYREIKMAWSLSGLLDAKTKKVIQNGGVIQLESYLATADGGQITKSSTYTLNVGNESVLKGSVTESKNKDKGLVPCGRDSALSPEGGAAGPRPQDTCTVYNFFELIVRVVNYLLLLSGFFATFQIVRSSFSMVLSQGNPEAISSAKKALTYSIIGFVFASMAFLLINTVVVGILGLKGGETILTDPAGYIMGN